MFQKEWKRNKIPNAGTKQPMQSTISAESKRCPMRRQENGQMETDGKKSDTQRKMGTPSSSIFPTTASSSSFHVHPLYQINKQGNKEKPSTFTSQPNFVPLFSTKKPLYL